MKTPWEEKTGTIFFTLIILIMFTIFSAAIISKKHETEKYKQTIIVLSNSLNEFESESIEIATKQKPLSKEFFEQYYNNKRAIRTSGVSDSLTSIMLEAHDTILLNTIIATMKQMNSDIIYEYDIQQREYVKFLKEGIKKKWK